MLSRVQSWSQRVFGAFALLLGMGALLTSLDAHAVPAYARQTGENCITCHVNFPELTPFGRYFKLSGYTLGKRTSIPLAGMLQISSTKIKNTGVDQTGNDPSTVGDGHPMLQQASLFVAGKLTDNIGIFNQWTEGYDGDTHHFGIDNTDIRYADRVWAQDVDFMYGITLHNNPTVQDVWNTTPAWGYPWASSGLANLPGPASTLIEGALAQQVAGLGGYFYWNKHVYAELTAYRTANGPFGIFRQGQDTANSSLNGGANALNGYNPYWRLALTQDMGPHSFMVGTFGMVTKLYPDSLQTTGPTDRYKDIGFDAQYQYITDPHTFTAQVTSVNETTNWDASGPNGPLASLGLVDNNSSTLKTFKAKAMYQWDRKYGVTLGYFSTTGDIDINRFGGGGAPVTGSANGSPDTRGNWLELHYLPRQDIKLSVLYTRYSKFNGASTNYDGNGRNASDNNNIYLLGWLMF